MYRVADCASSRQKRQISDNAVDIRSRVEYLDDAPTKPTSSQDRVPFDSDWALRKEKQPSRNGRIREYHVAVVEEEWEYAPKDRHLVLGGSLMDSEWVSVYNFMSLDKIKMDLLYNTLVKKQDIFIFKHKNDHTQESLIISIIINK